MKVILPVKYLEDGQSVTKPTGEKKYTVRRSVKVYAKDVPHQGGMDAAKGVVFLVDAGGMIYAVPDTDEVAVHGTAPQLSDFLDRVWDRQNCERH
jgi:hypothetical protein